MGILLVIRKQTLWKRLLAGLRLVLSIIVSFNLELSRNILDPLWFLAYHEVDTDDGDYDEDDSEDEDNHENF